MDKFLDRFKPKKAGGNKNPFANFRLPGTAQSFGGQGQSLGGSLPGKVIPVQLSEEGPLGIQIEKRPNSKGSAIVAMVVENSQAARAGLQRGDILCFAGSNGSEEIMYDMFLELARSKQRPLCFEVRRVQTKAAVVNDNNKNTNNADSFARQQAVIAAAEAREKKHKQKSKPIPKKSLPQMLSTADRHKLEQDRLSRLQEKEEPKSEAARQAVASAKNSEAQTAATLGYNPYETARSTAGQARTATVAMSHGAMQNTATTTDQPPAAPQKDAPTARSRSEPSLAFQHAFEVAVTSNDHAAVVSSFSILRKLLVNATTKGQKNEDDDAAKFRRVRLSNAKIKAAVVDTEGCLDILLSAGFRLCAEEDGESVLVFPPGDNGPDWLPSALQQLERYEKS